MQSVMSNIFNLIENFIDIINKKYCLIVGAKYYNSSMNNVCTILPGQYCWPPHKSHMANCTLFRKEISFRTAFVSAINQPTRELAHEVHLKYDI